MFCILDFFIIRIKSHICYFSVPNRGCPELELLRHRKLLSEVKKSKNQPHTDNNLDLIPGTRIFTTSAFVALSLKRNPNSHSLESSRQQDPGFVRFCLLGEKKRDVYVSEKNLGRMILEATISGEKRRIEHMNDLN